MNRKSDKTEHEINAERLINEIVSSDDILPPQCGPRMHAASFTLRSEVFKPDDDESKKKLAAAMMARGREVANEHCARNPVCPNGNLLELGVTSRPVEVDGKWEWDLQVIFDCK